MKLGALKRQIKQARKLSYFDERQYIAAKARQEARRIVIQHDRFQVAMDESEAASAKACGKAAPEPDELYVAKVERARELLGEGDSDARCAADQNVIDGFLIREGFSPDDPLAGRSYDELHERMVAEWLAEMRKSCPLSD